jgi:hypothetical protein
MKTGIAIALAWPQTYCKQAGAWYDGTMKLFGFSKNNYFQVGHAAIVLIDFKSTICHYFDFGRYHSPFGYGRVRSSKTDFDLKMKTKAKISKELSLLNYQAILEELLNNKACHGDGSIHASYTFIEFEKAYQKAMEMQEKSPIPYGPFLINGTNCSRFVRTVLVQGTNSIAEKIRLLIPYSVSPTPLTNVKSLNNQVILIKNEPVLIPSKQSKNELNSTLPEPINKNEVPQNSIWLAGEGAGSWFKMIELDQDIKVIRYSSTGCIENEGVFEGTSNFNLNQHFTITYPSNDRVLTIIQHNQLITIHVKPLILKLNTESFLAMK